MIKLTPEEIKNMKPGIFAEGIALDNQYGINMSRSGRQLRWVAVRGGAPDMNYPLTTSLRN